MGIITSCFEKLVGWLSKGPGIPRDWRPKAPPITVSARPDRKPEIVYRAGLSRPFIDRLCHGRGLALTSLWRKPCLGKGGQSSQNDVSITYGSLDGAEPIPRDSTTTREDVNRRIDEALGL